MTYGPVPVRGPGVGDLTEVTACVSVFFPPVAIPSSPASCKLFFSSLTISSCSCLSSSPLCPIWFPLSHFLLSLAPVNTCFSPNSCHLHPVIAFALCIYIIHILSPSPVPVRVQFCVPAKSAVFFFFFFLSASDFRALPTC